MKQLEPSLPAFMGSALARCIAPMTRERFFADYWDRHFFFHRGGQEAMRWMRDLLDLVDAQRLLEATNLRKPYFTLCAPGTDVTATASVERRRLDGGSSPGLADLRAIAGQLADGGTLVLRALERYHRPVTAFCADLTEELGHPIQANAFFSTSGAELWPHYDRGNLFALQVAGRKRWRLWEPPQPRPVVRDGVAFYDVDLVRATSEQSAPVLDVVLEAGDTLFVPRGYVHTTETEGMSLHVSVSANVRTWYDIVLDTASAAVLRGSSAISAFPRDFVEPDPEIRSWVASACALVRDSLDDAIVITATEPARSEGSRDAHVRKVLRGDGSGRDPERVEHVPEGFADALFAAVTAADGERWWRTGASVVRTGLDAAALPGNAAAWASDIVALPNLEASLLRILGLRHGESHRTTAWTNLLDCSDTVVDLDAVLDDLGGGAVVAVDAVERYSVPLRRAVSALRTLFGARCEAKLLVGAPRFTVVTVEGPAAATVVVQFGGSARMALGDGTPSEWRLDPGVVLLVPPDRTMQLTSADEGSPCIQLHISLVPESFRLLADEVAARAAAQVLGDVEIRCAADRFGSPPEDASRIVKRGLAALRDGFEPAEIADAAFASAERHVENDSEPTATLLELVRLGEEHETIVLAWADDVPHDGMDERRRPALLAAAGRPDAVDALSLLVTEPLRVRDMARIIGTSDAVRAARRLVAAGAVRMPPC